MINRIKLKHMINLIKIIINNDKEKIKNNRILTTMT